MGIYDREYYRGETGGSAWFSGVSPVCKSIIGINVAVFLLDQLINRGNNNPFIRAYLAASPDGTFHHLRIWELLTATFVHADIWHLLGNMLFLWIVGREMEALYGSRDFLAFYVCAAIFSTLVWCLIDAASNPDPTMPMVGASGAVMAAMMLFTLFYPEARNSVFLYSDADLAPGCSLSVLPPDPRFDRTFVNGRRRVAPGRGWICVPLQAVRPAVVAVLFGARVQAKAPNFLPGPTRANANADAQPFANVGKRGGRRQVGAGVRHPGRATRRQAR